MFLFEAPTSWSYKPITFQENKLASGWTQSRTMHFHYCKYWTEIASYCLNDIFIPSLNNYNTRSQMALDMRQKSMSFLCAKIWNMLSSNIKAAATTASFTHSLETEILEKLQQWATLLIFVDFSWWRNKYIMSSVIVSSVINFTVT